MFPVGGKYMENTLSSVGHKIHTVEKWKWITVYRKDLLLHYGQNVEKKLQERYSIQEGQYLVQRDFIYSQLVKIKLILTKRRQIIINTHYKLLYYFLYI